MRVLIVGAGPTGLTAALELARGGIVATVVDARSNASPFSRAVGITPRSLDYLAPSGVAARLVEEGVALQNAQIYRGDKLSLTLPIGSPITAFPHILGLPQDRTETIIAEAFAVHGGEVRYGRAVNAILQRESGVDVTFEDGATDHFDIVIGADGIRSTVRQAADFDYPGFDLAGLWSIADVDVDDWRHPEDFALFQAEPGQIAIVAPIGKKRFRVVATTKDALAAMPVAMNVTNVRRAAAFSLAVRQTTQYQSGDIYLAGDAAHCHSPVGGRGMNLGIGDAAELARAIIDGRTAAYSAHRHRAAAQVIAMTERGRRLVTGTSPLSARLFATGLSVLRNVEFARRRAGRFFVEF